MVRYNLMRLPGLAGLLASRWLQLVAQTVAAAGFGLAILTDLLGTPVGNRSFAIIAVWVAWGALLILAFVPLFGRAWCSVCPNPPSWRVAPAGGNAWANGQAARSRTARGWRARARKGARPLSC